jgi:hypothetical protein
MWALWKNALQNKRFLFHFILGLIGLTAFALFLPYFFIEILLPKPGEPWVDPILNFFTPRDWSIEIFVLIYLCSALGLVFNLTDPKTILLGLQMYVVVNFMRIASLYLFTLDAPEGIIPLSDPFLAVFAYGQPIYVKDLFFSGHISTLCVFLFIEKRSWLKFLIFVSTICVGILLAWQRVHYTLDMVAAVAITWAVFRFFRWFDVTFVHIQIQSNKNQGKD